MDRNGVLVFLTKVFFVIALIILIFFGFKSRNDENRKTFGRKIKDDLYIFSHEPLFNTGHKNPELEVLGIGQDDRAYFESPPDYFFTDYPQEPALDRSEWNIVHWRATPVNDREEELVALALDTAFSSFLSEDIASSLQRYLDLMDRYLRKEGQYYALRYKMEDHGPAAIHLFIVAPEQSHIFKLKRRY